MSRGADWGRTPRIFVVALLALTGLGVILAGAALVFAVRVNGNDHAGTPSMSANIRSAPAVVGESRTRATRRLQLAGFHVSVRELSSATIRVGHVIAETIATAPGGGGTATLTISTGASR